MVYSTGQRNVRVPKRGGLDYLWPWIVEMRTGKKNTSRGKIRRGREVVIGSGVRVLKHIDGTEMCYMHISISLN